VAGGRIDLHRFVDVASTTPARLFGLFPRKGTIQPGADADLVVYDPDHRRTITQAAQQMNVDYNPFQGFAIEGRPAFVTVRGEVAVENGKFVGTVGRGNLLRRDAVH
jgi:dihydropyrimidinase